MLFLSQTNQTNNLVLQQSHSQQIELEMNSFIQAQGNPLINDQYNPGQVQNTLHSNSDLVKQTTLLLESKNSSQRLQFAIQSFFDALNYQAPQIALQTNLLRGSYTKYAAIICKWQKSNSWKKTLTILCYVFMFTICLSAKKAQNSQIYIEWIFLLIIWADLLIEISNKILTKRLHRDVFQYHYIKIIVILFLSFDQIKATYIRDDRLRIISVIRVVLPLLYDSSLRMKISSILSLYKDFLVFVIFYSVVIFFFALITIQLAQIPEEKKIDDLTENYRDIGQAMVLLYVMSSYDSYPDNQLQAVRSQPTIYGLFILFIFMNILVFSNVPTGFLYQQFKNHYSISLLVQQTKRRNSLVCTFIALSDNEHQLSKSKLVDFLFALYRNKSNSVDTIAEICFKINLNITTNNSQFVQLSSFLQLCSAIQSNCQSLPHYLPYCAFWERIKKKINDIFDLNLLVYSTKFQITVAIIVFVSIVNSLLAFYSGYQIFDIIDNRLFVFIFVLQITIKIIGLGFQIFLRHALNIFDFAIVSLMVGLSLLNFQFIPHHSVPLLNILRFYRVPLIGKLLAEQKQTLNHNVFYMKSARLINQIILIFPVVISFFPVYLLVSYLLGLVGMWIYEEAPLLEPKESPYSKYHQFSNFETFINSQFVNIQILVEAGWSMILFDSSFRYGHRFLTTIYFICCHLIIVFVLSPLFKGVIWALYEALDKQSHKKLQKQKRAKSKEEFKEINLLEQRKMVESKKDRQMLVRLIKNRSEKTDRPNCQDTPDLSYYREKEMDFEFNEEEIYNSSQNLQQESNYCMKDNQGEYCKSSLCPESLANYLMKKCSVLEGSESEQSIHMDAALKTVKQMLNIRRDSKKERLIRASIHQILQQQGTKLYTRQRKERQAQINNQEMLLKTFLKNLDHQSIKQFQQLHLLNNYSKYFQAQIMSKLSTSVLARQSELMAAFSLLLSSKYISLIQFFSNLSVIESSLSSQVLPKGSFFKFLFRLNNGPYKNWFTVEVNPSRQLDLHFVKNGIWIWHESMASDRVYFAKDIFSLEQENTANEKNLVKQIKMLFKTIETFSLYTDFCHNFLNYNPNKREYDFYSYWKMVENKESGHRIDRISVVLLSNQKKRQNPLLYQLSSIQSSKGNSNKNILQKIKRATTLEQLKTENQQSCKGISGDLILNLMIEITDLLRIHSKSVQKRMSQLQSSLF